MSAYAFLSILSPVVGLLSSLFFAIGTIHLKTSDIQNMGASIINHNPYLIQAFAAQKAEYICGAILLFIAFGLQLVANVWAAGGNAMLFESIYLSWAIICAIAAALGIGARWLRSVILAHVAKSLPKPRPQA